MGIEHVELPLVTVTMARHFTPGDNMRPVLDSVMVESTEDGGTSWAADGFALAKADLPFPVGATTVPEPDRFIGQVIVPRKAILNAAKITKRGEKLAIRLVDEQWFIGQYPRISDRGVIDDVWMTFTPINGTYPNVVKLLTTEKRKLAEYRDDGRSIALSADMMEKIEAITKVAGANQGTPSALFTIGSQLQATHFAINGPENVEVLAMPVIGPDAYGS